MVTVLSDAAGNWYYVRAFAFKIIYESELADIIICKSMEDLIKNKTKDKALAYYKKVFSNKDIDDIESAITNGANYIIVDADDWKIIPLENIIANLQNTRTKIFTTAKNSEEVRTMFAVLELGVDGVILSTGNVKDIEKSKQYLKPKKFEINTKERSFNNIRYFHIRDMCVAYKLIFQ